MKKLAKMNYWSPKSSDLMSGLELKKFKSKKRILKHLYHDGELSSAEIGKILRLSAPTTLAYLNELIEEDYIEDRGKGSSIGGRRPNLYGLKKDSVYVVGVDITRRHISSSIFNHELESVSEVRVSSYNLKNETSIELIQKEIEAVIYDSKIDPDKIMGIGITMPGLIDSELGINYTYLFDEGKSLVDILQKYFNRPVFLENDAKARTLAEFRYGAAKDYLNVLYLQVDWGLGTGMIFNGKLYRGNSGFAGEFAHILLETEGKLCTCGKRGCLETVASGDALIEDALSSLNDNVESAIYKFCQNQDARLTPRKIIDFAKQGDQFALSLINKLGLALGKGISYLIQILNPELIVLGGRVCVDNEYLETSIKQSLYNYCIPKLREDAKVVQSKLGNQVGILGAAVVVMEQILEN
jgi:glucokinase-like ROK family protein